MRLKVAFLRQGKIEYTKAKAIAKVKDEDTRTELLKTAITENLSIREIRERIKALSVIFDESETKEENDG